MTKDVYIVSDTHWNHANILNFTDYQGSRTRTFDDVDQMNDCLLTRWNETVKPNDKVYHLGDVFFGSKEKFERHWPRFHGKKKLIVGNHDDIAYLVGLGSDYFYDFALDKYLGDLYLTHIPVNVLSTLKHKKSRVNVHGHIHTNKTPDGPYMNVCVEVRDYRPVHLEDLIVEARPLKKANDALAEKLFGKG